MNISENGKNLIKSFEGCRLNAYKAVPTEQYYTIGWGHYGSDVYQGMTITQEQADTLFDKDVERYINAVRNHKMAFEPNQNQFDALCSFCYNLGVGIIRDFDGLNANQVAEQIPLYVNSGGIKLQGLVNRRNKELELFNKPVENKNEVIKVDYIIQYSNSVDQAIAEVMADRLNCPTINCLRPYAFYGQYKTVIAVGESKNRSGYTNVLIQGKDRKETLEKAIEYCKSLGR